MIVTEFGEIIAERIRAEHENIAARWFERLSALLPVEAAEVFPSSSLLDHIPTLVVDISHYLQAPEEEAIAANTAVVEKARQLGSLRHDQRASLHQVLREYQLLGGILVAFVGEETARLLLTPPAKDMLALISRLHQAVNVLMQETVETFVALYTRTISDQAERLQQFARMATHEWRQPLGSLQMAVALLREPGIDRARTRRALEVADRNVKHLVDLTRKIESVARLSSDNDDPIVQEISIATIAGEAARQLREMAQVHEVRINIADGLPSCTVDVGRLELVLINLLSNAIKYADSGKSDRFVEVTGARLDESRCEIVIRDNGIGIPADRINSIFDAFSRARDESDEALRVAGVGLGLSIVADCIRAISGTIDVQSEEAQGCTFRIRLPIRPTSPTA